MRYPKYLISIILFFILATSNVWANQAVQLLSKRHRTEKNWVEYRVSLKNTSENPIVNPDIHYYASDTVLSVAIDYISNPYTVTPSVTPVSSKTSDIKLTVHGTLAPGKKVNINFRIHQKKWKNYDFKKDWSHQRNANVSEPNYFMTVYDASHNILWGDDPLNGNHNTGDVVTWNDRGLNTAVTRYNGGNEYIPAGRFWLFKDTPLSPKERDLLAQRGISKLSIGRSRGKIIGAFKTSAKLKKKTLDSLVAGFYNAIPVADTVPVAIDLTDEDLHSEKTECDANGHCQNVIEPRSHLETHISCWNDVDLNDCITTIRSCGGDKIGVARGFIEATVAKDSLQCLSKKKDVEALNIQRKMALTNNSGRESIKISNLQDSEAWKKALEKDSADLDWLKGADYTGEGIIVGVYDERVDFNHPAFNEYDSSGTPHPRLIQKDEFFGNDYDKIYKGMNVKLNSDSNFINNTIKKLNHAHGTSVAGTIGGNGNTSSNFIYRGVAPKVHYFTNDEINTNQVGHVTNHSHISTKFAYGSKEFAIDDAIFKNWKSGCTTLSLDSTDTQCIEGDTLVKTVIYAAGNNGYNTPNIMKYGIQQSYHSILSPAKNPIIVGMISANEKIRVQESSMGPTWDGRIKPDVMAPGISTLLFKADTSNPFEFWIDYIKMFRQGQHEPYINLDFETNHLALDSNSAYPSLSLNLCEEVNNQFHCTINHQPHSSHNQPTKMFPPVVETYISWKLDDKVIVYPTDDIEIRYRIAKGKIDKDTHLYGALYFGQINYSYGNIESVFTPWRVTDEFEVTRTNVGGLYLGNGRISQDSIYAHSLRIDFDFLKGITAPICSNNRCDYMEIAAGGTSNAAPFVTGLAALMYQKFQKQTGDSLNKHSMRNSTVKALIIHTAVDMEDSEEAHFACNTDLTVAHNDGECHFTPYGKGPDFATGWGYVDGKAALDLISGYNTKTKEFSKFKEIEIGNGHEKRWTINVDSTRKHLRTTLVWDDSPGNIREESLLQDIYYKEPKLVNDLDMYLISPSGKYYYPWRLDTLPPTDFIDPLGNLIVANPSSSKGYENIHESDIKDAKNDCNSSEKLGYKCFDHLNNVEVVDIENPELGKWQVVVFGYSVTDGNNDSLNAQVATLVSDLPLYEGNKSNAIGSCKVTAGYAPQTDYSCTYKLGKDLVYYVTFHDSTSVGSGDDIVLTDGEGKNIGIYVGNELAGKTIKVKSSKLTVTLHSDNDKSQGWGFDVTGIHSVNHAILKMPFEATKKKRRTP